MTLTHDQIEAQVRLWLDYLSLLELSDKITPTQEREIAEQIVQWVNEENMQQ